MNDGFWVNRLSNAAPRRIRQHRSVADGSTPVHDPPSIEIDLDLAPLAPPRRSAWVRLISRRVFAWLLHKMVASDIRLVVISSVDETLVPVRQLSGPPTSSAM